MRPGRLIAFTNDRLCKDCSTRYTPPTPLWAAFVFVAGGSFLALIGLVGMVAPLAGLLLRRREQGPSSADVLSGILCNFLCTGLILLLGVLALVHGIRSIAHSGKA
jgi:hypothetical protein